MDIEGEPGKVTMVRQLYWVNKVQKFYNHFSFSLSKWGWRSKLKAAQA